MLLRIAPLLSLILLSPCPAVAENFLVLVADDLGVDKVGVYSDDTMYGHPGEGASPGPTPRIDQLAEEGVLFRNAYAYAQCSPTRAATLTGRHGFRTGVGQPGGAFLDLAETTIAERITPTHRSAAIGKWHISGSDLDHPIDQGFEYYAGPLQNLGNGTTYTLWNKTTNSTTTAGSTQTGFMTYVTTDNVDEAAAQITAFGTDPWFVWLAFTAPHGPSHVPPSTLTTIAVDQNSDTPTMYAAMVEAMDTEIARLLSGIPQAILDDTTIIFVGDNGTPSPAVEAPFISNRAKGSMYEGGINVPFIVQSPHIAEADEGSESLALVNTTDVYATLAELAGLVSSAEDSVSIVPHLEDPALGTRRRCAYAERFAPNGFGPYTEHERAARDDRYKLIWRDGVYEEFFDLQVDAFEQDNRLPVSNLSVPEAEAYAVLVDAMENGTCASTLLPAVPLLPASVMTLAMAIALRATALLGRRR